MKVSFVKNALGPGKESRSLLVKHIGMGGWSPYGPAMQARHNEGTPYCGVKENEAIKIEK